MSDGIRFELSAGDAIKIAQKLLADGDYERAARIFENLCAQMWRHISAIESQPPTEEP